MLRHSSSAVKSVQFQNPRQPKLSTAADRFAGSGFRSTTPGAARIGPDDFQNLPVSSRRRLIARLRLADPSKAKKDLLKEAIGDADATVRALAVCAYARQNTGDNEVRRQLLCAALDADEDVRNAARHFLGLPSFRPIRPAR